MKSTTRKLLLTLTLSALASPAAVALGHHHMGAHRNFIQRHPVVSAIGGGLLVHHFMKRRH